MARYDSSTAQIVVFTYKEGLLSAVAHDLKIKVTKFELDVDLASGRMQATIDAASLRVICAMKDAQENPSALAPMLFGEIEKNMHGSAVLDVKQFGTVRFAATEASEREVAGELTLHGVTRAIRGVRVDTPSHVVAEFRIDQREFGIKPFSAMLGTLKIKPEVLIRASLPK